MTSRGRTPRTTLLRAGHPVPTHDTIAMGFRAASASSFIKHADSPAALGERTLFTALTRPPVALSMRPCASPPTHGRRP